MEVYIIGCGGNSKIIIDICLLKGYTISGIFDDTYSGTITEKYCNINLIGNINDIKKYNDINIINSIGNNNIRLNIYNELKYLKLNWINCIHPNINISPSANIGIGNIICNGVIINSDVKIGNFNLINTYTLIEHDCVIGDFNHLAPRTTLCGGIKIGNLNLLGASMTAIPNISIGNANTIGCMTGLIKNIDDNNTVVGVPGKIIKRRNPL
ncbi:acetyltransferase domain protein [Cotonvirus japonicus]|uniref:Acetyltransferase domain protein n=1 Tax=Cotonvirus japonicus TaxID=2811091 RepID=A0ABM7NSR3_9VIRU|nr:acetyltransferase domain protein [Cotonvirus japonicus]BCS83208.1 acetyltransferase domain protein [Cotonvirus japonicus]